MKIASWNVNSLRVRLPHVESWLAAAAPDVLGLQETKLTDPDFPAQAFEAAGYKVAFSGQKTYNGVALLARTQPMDVVTDLPGMDDPQRRVLAATVDGIRVLNLYVPNGQALESEKFIYKMDWLACLKDYIEDQLRSYDELVVMGDFNITPADQDVHDPAAWAGGIHCSEPERDALNALGALGLTDTFRLHHDDEDAFSWWDYRKGSFRRNAGLRIDLVLASGDLAARCTTTGIDLEPRTWERPSDHAPAWAEFERA